MLDPETLSSLYEEDPPSNLRALESLLTIDEFDEQEAELLPSILVPFLTSPNPQLRQAAVDVLAHLRAKIPNLPEPVPRRAHAPKTTETPDLSTATAATPKGPTAATPSRTRTTAPSVALTGAQRRFVVPPLDESIARLQSDSEDVVADALRTLHLHDAHTIPVETVQQICERIVNIERRFLGVSTKTLCRSVLGLLIDAHPKLSPIFLDREPPQFELFPIVDPTGDSDAGQTAKPDPDAITTSTAISPERLIGVQDLPLPIHPVEQEHLLFGVTLARFKNCETLSAAATKSGSAAVAAPLTRSLSGRWRIGTLTQPQNGPDPRPGIGHTGVGHTGIGHTGIGRPGLGFRATVEPIFGNEPFTLSCNVMEPVSFTPDEQVSVYFVLGGYPGVGLFYPTWQPFFIEAATPLRRLWVAPLPLWRGLLGLSPREWLIGLIIPNLLWIIYRNVLEMKLSSHPFLFAVVFFCAAIAPLAWFRHRNRRAFNEASRRTKEILEIEIQKYIS